MTNHWRAKPIPTTDLLGSSARETEMAGKFIDALTGLDIHKTFTDVNDMANWVSQAELIGKDDRISTPLGHFDNVVYYVDIGRLGPLSLNCRDDRWKHSVVDSLVDLEITYTTGEVSKHRAIPVVRLIALHDPGTSSVSKSSWILFCDSDKSLYACHASDVPSIPNVNASDDNVFNADKGSGELVVPICKVDHQRFTQSTPLNSIKPLKAQWSTTSARVFDNLISAPPRTQSVIKDSKPSI